MTNKNKSILIILDGWGLGEESERNVIHTANTPYMDSLMEKYPNSRLHASGENVGLPEGQMGNSEVGHLNIGAGRVVYQDLVRINKAIEDGTFDQNQVLNDAFQYAKENNAGVHFIGLVSDGGVHSSDKHLYKLADMTGDYGLDKVYIHALTDGRDTDPYSGKGYLGNLQDHLNQSNGQIASLVGRFYGMDRDKRWDRIKEAYDLFAHGKGKQTKDVVQAIQESYDNGLTDEFIKPIVVTDENDQPVGTIRENDVVICFNFRTDRLREITQVLTQQDMPEHGMQTMPLYYLTMTNYDKTFKGVKVIYGKEDIVNTMGEIVAKNNKKQLRIAETEKYAHVTFFFSGGREKKFDNEKRILINSPQEVKTYDEKPEMSAYEVKDAVVEEMKKQEMDFICLNFANCDMVGHTGVYEAIRQAVEAVDSCLRDVVEAAKANGYEAIIIADHGNADNAVNKDGSPNTAHSTDPVPFVLVSENKYSVKDGILADVAPSLLKLMNIQQPEEMTGKCLIF
ncbi:MAG: 2,3-bisphosphoglycerate-independent phosphoglycerate mutase [Bacteroidales bacterium]|nr:2,3-bisphosphoglycerate-independent phosphoglycerate mutase [Bacteroidales bacterium]MBS3774707.1 2,3-bisphosphoglycerate-independent phosphoglycerate mutase [Bacteroidales bacterium]